MSKTVIIALKQLRFLAYHGLYAEEQKTGNEFEVDLVISHDPDGTITDLSDTVNYVTLYEMLKTEMRNPRRLLETFAMETADNIHAGFPNIRKVEIAITKLQPPIPHFTGRVTVRYIKEY
jgi:7,8-dihydroneopterin aldolase/epimerase/oxygenase